MLQQFRFILVFLFSHYLEMVNELERKLEQLKLANQKLQRNSRGSVFHGVHDESTLIRRSSTPEFDEPIHIRAQVTNSASITLQMATMVSLLFTFTLWINQRY